MAKFSMDRHVICKMKKFVHDMTKLVYFYIKWQRFDVMRGSIESREDIEETKTRHFSRTCRPALMHLIPGAILF